MTRTLKQVKAAKKHAIKKINKNKPTRVYPEKIKRERVIPPKFEKFLKSVQAKKDASSYPRTVIFTKSKK